MGRRRTEAEAGRVTELVVLTPEQLDALVRRAVAEGVAEALERDRKRWLTAAEVGERLDFSQKTVQNRSAPSIPEADRIPSHTLTPGGEKRFDPVEVDEWLRRRS
jgi:hypothetical protein